MKLSTKRQSAFTTIELLITVSLMGITAAVFIPNLLSIRKSNELNSSTKAIVGWLEDLRNQAIQQSKPCSATWDLTQGLITGTCDGTTTSVFDINSSTQLTVVASRTSTNEPITWTFTPRGTSTTSGQFSFKLEQHPNDPGRCLKLTSPLGLIRAGKRSSSGTCDYTKSF